jgi:accessory gene regulator protein AgrB
MKTEPIEGSETLAIRIKTPGNYTKENILHIEHVESLKSRIAYFSLSVTLHLDYTCITSNGSKLTSVTPRSQIPET